MCLHEPYWFIAKDNYTRLHFGEHLLLSWVNKSLYLNDVHIFLGLLDPLPPCTKFELKCSIWAQQPDILCVHHIPSLRISNKYSPWICNLDLIRADTNATFIAVDSLGCYKGPTPFFFNGEKLQKKGQMILIAWHFKLQYGYYLAGFWNHTFSSKKPNVSTLKFKLCIFWTNYNKCSPI